MHEVFQRMLRKIAIIACSDKPRRVAAIVPPFLFYKCCQLVLGSIFTFDNLGAFNFLVNSFQSCSRLNTFFYKVANTAFAIQFSERKFSSKVKCTFLQCQVCADPYPHKRKIVTFFFRGFKNSRKKLMQYRTRVHYKQNVKIMPLFP